MSLNALHTIPFILLDNCAMCRADSMKYFDDMSRRPCNPSTYGWCGGNFNRFLAQYHCISNCGKNCIFLYIDTAFAFNLYLIARRMTDISCSLFIQHHKAIWVNSVCLYMLGENKTLRRNVLYVVL